MTKKSKLKKFENNIDNDVLNCPSETTNVKNNFAQIKNTLNHRKSLSKADQKSLNNYEKSMCEAYNNITTKNTINVIEICKEIKETTNYIDKKINSSTNPSLILIGELHQSTESFLIEISILNNLIKKGLSKELLTECTLETIYNYMLPPSSFLALDARHFAYNVLGYNLIAIDKFHPSSGQNVNMDVRENEMKNTIISISKNSPDKAIVGTIGYSHLAAFKQLEQDSELNVIIINAAKPSATERKLSAMNLHKSKSEIKELYNTIDSFKFLGFKQNLESITFKQALNIFKTCNRKSEIMSSEEYISAKGLEACNMLDITDFVGCEPNYVHTEL